MLVPLLVAIVLFLSSLLVYGMAMHLVVRVVVRLTRSGHRELGFWKSTAVMAIVTLIVSTGHLTQIGLWGLAYRMGGQSSSLGAAFYFSAQAYTALGTDIQLTEHWKFLCPLEAMDGSVFFGLSTAVLFAILNQLVASRLRAETGYDSEALGNLVPLPVASVKESSLTPAPLPHDRGGPASQKEQAGMGPASSVTLAVFEGALA